jgi:hypothetical protein
MVDGLCAIQVLQRPSAGGSYIRGGLIAKGGLIWRVAHVLWPLGANPLG